MNFHRVTSVCLQSYPVAYGRYEQARKVEQEKESELLPAREDFSDLVAEVSAYSALSLLDLFVFLPTCSLSLMPVNVVLSLKGAACRDRVAL